MKTSTTTYRAYSSIFVPTGKVTKPYRNKNGEQLWEQVLILDSATNKRSTTGRFWTESEILKLDPEVLEPKELS